VVDESGPLSVHLQERKSVQVENIAGFTEKVGKAKGHETRHVDRSPNPVGVLGADQSSNFG